MGSNFKEMKKYIVLSVNDNVDYLYYTPLSCWAWRKFGWEPILFYHRSTRPYKKAKEDEHHRESSLAKIEQLISDTILDCQFRPNFLDSIEGYRSDTITQISRLYASCLGGEYSGHFGAMDYLMTGDIDMLPLSDYWKPGDKNVTVWGHDLTGYGHYPICYIGMPAVIWQYVMGLTNNNYNEMIKRDLDTLPQAKNPDFYKYWFSDQDLITARLNKYGKDSITFINRGQGSHGYARGRVDRGSGGWVLNQPELIDAHLMQQTHHSDEKINKLNELLHHVWPSENFDWFKEYTNEFRKLAV